MRGRIVIAGATGFVGQHVYQTLSAADRDRTVCTSRHPDAAARRFPEREWAALDVDDPASIRALLRPGDRILYLVHSMGDGPGYAEREEAAARALAAAANEVGAARIVYLGGPQPPGAPSRHLSSRLRTGEVLREGFASTIELRAGMIMGAGSESWRITRDLATRLPVMLLPAWLRNKCEPIAIDDVAAALIHALDAPDELAGAWDLPGPERMTYAEALFRVAEQGGTRPIAIPVPLLTPKLSSHWLRLVTRADMLVARELVEGLAHDLVAYGDGYFANMAGFARTPFDVGARRALEAEALTLPLSSRFFESLLKRVARRAPTG